MKEKNTISVIIPVYKLDDTTKQMLVNAIKSIEDQIVKPNEILLIVDKNDTETLNYVKSIDFNTIKEITKIIENESGNTDFVSQFNLGVEKSTSNWISLLEQDDEFSKIWFKNVYKYQDCYPDVDLFLPIVIDVNTQNQFLSLTNEAVWAHSFSDKLGFLDNTALDAYQNFNIDGMVIKKETYLAYGGIKKNIKLTFIYEFLLRMTLKDVKTMVIPKFGYKHVNQREGSLFNEYSKTMNPVEAKWWLDKAKKEQYFPKDREITYDSSIA